MLFNERLKELRLNSARLQKDIAKMLGISVRTFQGWETGRSEPSIEKLIALADLFDVSLDYLMGYHSPSTSAGGLQTNPLDHPNE